MEMKIILLLMLTFTISLCSCNEYDKNKHDKKLIILNQSKNDQNIVFKTLKADFYFDKNEYIEYCKKENYSEAKDFVYNQILQYIDEYKDDPVIIPDTLGTKMILDTEWDTILLRVKNHNHPYVNIAEEISWDVFKFAKKGKLRIFHNKDDKFLDSIKIDKVDADWYGEISLTLTNDSVLYSKITWIK